MKKLIALLLLVALLPLARADEAGSSEVIHSYRVWVKPGHTEAFNQALAAHARQFHRGAWAWRVYDVQTGPDGGSVQIDDGPHSWSAFEDRGDLGDKHRRDYERNVLPHIEKTAPASYVVYKPEFSTTAIGNFPSKALVVHVHPKAGQFPLYLASLKEFRPVWEKLGLDMVVYTSVHSGDRSVILVQRLKHGLKDFEPNGANVRAAYDAINGAGSYDRRSDEQARILDSLVTSLMSYRPEFTVK